MVKDVAETSITFAVVFAASIERAIWSASSLSSTKAVAPVDEPFAISHGALTVTREPSEEIESKDISPTFVILPSPAEMPPLKVAASLKVAAPVAVTAHAKVASLSLSSLNTSDCEALASVV